MQTAGIALRSSRWRPVNSSAKGRAQQWEPPLPQEITFPPERTASAMILDACSIFESASRSFKNWVRTLEASCSSVTMAGLKSMLFGSCGGRAGLLGFLDVVDLLFQGIVLLPEFFHFLPGPDDVPPGPGKVGDDKNHSDERQVFEPPQIAVK